MPADYELARVNRRICWVAILAALYSAFVAAWFFAFLARNSHQAFTQVVGPLAIFSTLAVLPYALAWFAQKLSTSTRGSKVALGVVYLCALSSLLFYLPGLNPVQDGYFLAVFAMLGIVQS